jgi:hypothetical protein
VGFVVFFKGSDAEFVDEEPEEVEEGVEVESLAAIDSSVGSVTETAPAPGVFPLGVALMLCRYQMAPTIAASTTASNIFFFIRLFLCDEFVGPFYFLE